MDGVLAGPARGREQRIQAICVGPLVGVRDHLAADGLLILGCVGDPPLDQRGRKRHFQCRDQFVDSCAES